VIYIFKDSLPDWLWHSGSGVHWDKRNTVWTLSAGLFAGQDTKSSKPLSLSPMIPSMVLLRYGSG
jgi:hypothetical protein